MRRERTEQDEINVAKSAAKQIAMEFDAGVMAMARARVKRGGIVVDLALEDYDSFLKLLPVHTLRRMSDHFPDLVEPWEIVSMRHRRPSETWRPAFNREPIARCRVMRSGWVAYVGNEMLMSGAGEGEGETMLFPTLEAAQAACDERLRDIGVIFTEGK